MEGYEQMTMSPYLGSLERGTPGDDYLGHMPLNIPEQSGTFETGDFAAGSDDMFLPHEQSRPYSTAFDDPLSEATLMEAIPSEQAAQESSIDRDNKLLSFHLPTYNFTLLDYGLRQTTLLLTAQLHGMFFMAESPSSVPETNMTPPELTCYRRNLFQITGSITLPRTLRYILTDQGDRIPILAQELSISATESVEGGPVKLISVPWKTPASTAIISPDEKTEKEPTSITLDTMSNQDMDADYATFPIAWKRLQFRIATANNGRRKELQQHFVVRLKVVATLSTGAKVSICEAKSGAIIVRGRSPRNFQSRKDFPVGGTASNNRKGMHPPASNRASTESAGPKSPAKVETSPEQAQAFTSFNFDQQDGQSPTKITDWNKSGKLVPASNARTSSRSESNSKSPPTTPTLLSLNDDSELNRTRQRTGKVARKTSSTSSSRPVPYKHPSLPSTTTFLNTHSQSSLSDGLDPADLLYEYFPVGLDDWMPPVDAVYRPHVVHHMNIGQTAAAGGRAGLTGRSKRYFSEDQA